jgi:NAD-dependent dihydropyrimidine dehydrogenase PreA subunit
MIYLKDTVTLELDVTKCNGCAMCTMVCPHNVFALRNKKAAITNRDKCMECGACARNCPEGAIYVRTGVGCAAGILNGILQNTERACSCFEGKSGCC